MNGWASAFDQPPQARVPRVWGWFCSVPRKLVEDLREGLGVLAKVSTWGLRAPLGRDARREVSAGLASVASLHQELPAGRRAGAHARAVPREARAGARPLESVGWRHAGESTQPAEPGQGAASVPAPRNPDFRSGSRMGGSFSNVRTFRKRSGKLAASRTGRTPLLGRRCASLALLEEVRCSRAHPLAS